MVKKVRVHMFPESADGTMQVRVGSPDPERWRVLIAFRGEGVKKMTTADRMDIAKLAAERLQARMDADELIVVPEFTVLPKRRAGVGG